MVCLFLFSTLPHANAGTETQWRFDDQTAKAYRLVLNLQFEEAHQIIPSPATAQQHYVVALAEALELLITEDGEKFTELEDRFTQRLERKTKTNIPEDLFLQGEIRMQWAFVYLKFGHEFDAALNLRQAYLTIRSLQERFPEFQAVKKTSGLLNVVIGSVPQKYNWVLSLLNMEGSAETGIRELESIRLLESPLAFESHLLHALVQGFLLQQPSAGLQEIKNVLGIYPDNRLALFLGSALAKKNAQSEEALIMLDSLDKQTAGLPLPLAHFLRGEIYLCKGDYPNAIASYRWFIGNYRGQNGVKDSHYKIGLCYWLRGNQNDARASFSLARTLGKEASEGDKYAARSLADSEFPHVPLTKARYAMDGGYYEQAKLILDSLEPSDLPTRRDKVEYNYRKARLAHSTGDLSSAKEFYLQSIGLSGDEPWYYAPNACLQMGYITWQEGNDSQAKNYFNKALTYNKHEYKNSIDSKAKSAIAQIRRK